MLNKTKRNLKKDEKPNNNLISINWNNITNDQDPLLAYSIEVTKNIEHLKEIINGLTAEDFENLSSLFLKWKEEFDMECLKKKQHIKNKESSNATQKFLDGLKNETKLSTPINCPLFDIMKPFGANN